MTTEIPFQTIVSQLTPAFASINIPFYSNYDEFNKVLVDQEHVQMERNHFKMNTNEIDNIKNIVILIVLQHTCTKKNEPLAVWYESKLCQESESISYLQIEVLCGFVSSTITHIGNIWSMSQLDEVLLKSQDYSLYVNCCLLQFTHNDLKALVEAIVQNIRGQKSLPEYLYFSSVNREGKSFCKLHMVCKKTIVLVPTKEEDEKNQQ